jgi:hypothetical protein
MPKHAYAIASFGKKKIKVDAGRRMSFPLVKLADGGAFSLALYEHNMIFADELLATVSFKRSGDALVHAASSKRDADATCSVHARPAIEEEARRRWIAAMDELEVIDSAVHVDLGKPHFGLEARAPATQAVQALANLVGWDDPRVRALTAHIAAQEARFDVGLKAALDVLGTKNGSDPAYTMVGARCGPGVKASVRPEYARTKCVVDVTPTAELYNDVTSTTQIVFESGAAVDADLVLDRTRPNESIRPEWVPIEHENEKPWAVVRRTTKSITIVRVP